MERVIIIPASDQADAEQRLQIWLDNHPGWTRDHTFANSSHDMIEFRPASPLPEYDNDCAATEFRIGGNPHLLVVRVIQA